MLRRLFTLLSALSIMLCVGTVALWALSYSPLVIEIVWGRNQYPQYRIYESRGCFQLQGTYPSARQGFYIGELPKELPCWIPAAVFAFFSAALNAPRVVSYRKAVAGKCAQCGYDLRATPGRCPECGTVPARKKENST